MSMEWGSVQYDDAYKRFHSLKGMDRQAALATLGVSRLLAAKGAIDYYHSESREGDEPIARLSAAKWLARARDDAWDLWEAAEVVCRQLFDISIPKYPDTGAQCYLIWVSGALDEADPDEIFSDFAT